MMKYDVFISYSTKDKLVAEGICGYLERYGVRCFVAYRDVPPGKVWADEITEGIDNSRVMVAIFSKEFNSSVQTSREIELASEAGLPILTFRITDDEFSKAKKYYLKNVNWIDAFPQPEKAFGTLLENVNSLLGRKTKTDPFETNKGTTGAAAPTGSAEPKNGPSQSSQPPKTPSVWDTHRGCVIAGIVVVALTAILAFLFVFLVIIGLMADSSSNSSVSDDYNNYDEVEDTVSYDEYDDIYADSVSLLDGYQ